MRLLLLLAVVAFIVALVANLVPTSPLGINDTGWVIIGLLLWCADELLEGRYLVPGRRAAP